MKVLFLGSNPLECSSNDLFKMTKGWIKLEKWIEYLELEEHEYYLDCASMFVKEGNAPISKKDILYQAPCLLFRMDHVYKPTHVVALGLGAARACEVLDLDYFKIPSVISITDERFVRKRLELCKIFLNKE